MRFAALFCLLVSFLFSAPIVELTVQERAGVARVNEPVLMGVPLPEAAGYSDTSLFTLRDASGNVIPCEFRAASRWLRNRTALRWIHLDFQASLPAGGTQKVTLHSETAPYSAASKLAVTDRTTYLEVNTGKIRFYVKKANFNVIDQAWVDESGAENYTSANQVVAAHARGLIEKASAVQYLSSNDAASVTVVERRGPMAVALKATGTLKSSAGAGSFAFVTRIYAYNNSSIVKIENTIENRASDVNAFVMLADLRVEIPLALSGTVSGLVSRPGGYRQSVLSGAEELYCYSRRPAGALTGVNAVAGGKLADTTFSPKALKSKDIGWAALYGTSHGCVVGVKDMWRQFPGGVEVNGQGRVVAGLFSERPASPLEIYAGVSRTQMVRLAFFNTKTPGEMRALGVSADNPLFAIAPAAWYCRYTYSMGRLAEKNPALFSAANLPVVNSMDSKLSGHWVQIFNAIEGRNGTDSYGYLGWGDITHYVYCAITNPWCLGWDGNYYDIAQMGFHHFARTADPQYLDFGIAHANHIEDVHMTHFGPGQGNTGSNRYCPPNNHVNNDNANTPGGWVENHTSHHKTQSVFENYWLTGDPRALDVAVEGCNWVRGFGTSFCTGDNIATYERRVSHQLHSLYFGYYQARNVNYFNTTALIFSALKTAVRSRVAMGADWQNGMLMEAMAGMYFQFADQYPDSASANFYLKDSLLVLMKDYADWKYTTSYENSAYGYAFLSSFYGSVYLTRASEKFNMFNPSYSNTGKDFAENGRSNELAIYYFAIPDSVKNLVGAENRSTVNFGKTLQLIVMPNPFAGSMSITLPGDLPASGLSVYDLQGRKIAALSGLPAIWKAPASASGVYVIRCTAGGKTLEKRVTLIR